MKHDKTFRALQTTFDDPDSIDDCTEFYSRPDHEDDRPDCATVGGCRPIAVCGETRCRFCGERIG